MLLLLVVMFGISLYAYQHLPARVASHWNAQGQVDSYMGKFWGVFLIPLTALILAGLFWLIPIIDPLKANIARFRDAYNGLMVAFTLFMLLVQLQVVLWNLGMKITPNAIFPVGVGLLYMYIGWLLKQAKRNWFVGVRTPWTLSSDTVWDKTHQLASKGFIAAGVVTIIGVFFPSYSIWFMLVPVLAVATYAVIYSYVLYQQEVLGK